MSQKSAPSELDANIVFLCNNFFFTLDLVRICCLMPVKVAFHIYYQNVITIIRFHAEFLQSFMIIVMQLWWLIASELITVSPTLSILTLPNFVTICYMIQFIHSLTLILLSIQHDNVMTIIRSGIKFASSLNVILRTHRCVPKVISFETTKFFHHLPQGWITLKINFNHASNSMWQHHDITQSGTKFVCFIINIIRKDDVWP